MALKYEIETLDGLDDTIKALYQKNEDGKFTLAVDGLPKADNTLSERLAKLEANNRDLLGEKKAAKEEAERIKLEAAKKGGDIEALEKSWQEKYMSAESAKNLEVEQYKKMVSGLTVGAAAATIAADVFGANAELMMHHVNARLGYEVVDGQPRVRVLDLTGKPCALTVDELKNEFKASAKFAPFVVATRASGAGAHGSAGGIQTGKKFAEYTGAELAAIRKKSQADYDKLKAGK